MRSYTKNDISSYIERHIVVVFVFLRPRGARHLSKPSYSMCMHRLFVCVHVWDAGRAPALLAYARALINAGRAPCCRSDKDVDCSAGRIMQSRAVRCMSPATTETRRGNGPGHHVGHVTQRTNPERSAAARASGACELALAAALPRLAASVTTLHAAFTAVLSNCDFFCSSTATNYIEKIIFVQAGPAS